MVRLRTLVVCALVSLGLSGCVSEPAEYDKPLTAFDFKVPRPINNTLSTSEITWPDFSNASLVVLALDDTPWFSAAAKEFTALTGAGVQKKSIASLNDTKGDVVYGLDTFTLGEAIADKHLREYRPQLAQRIATQHRFFDPLGPWHATPTDHGRVGLFFDEDELPEGVELASMFDVRDNAPLLGVASGMDDWKADILMLIAVGRFGENDAYDHLDYWIEMGRGIDRLVCTGDEVTLDEEGVVRVAYQKDAGDDTLLPDAAALRVVRTTAVHASTDQRAVAEAWIEYTLTDEFQALVGAEGHPVVGPDPFDKRWFTSYTFSGLQDRLDAWRPLVVDAVSKADCA